MRTPGSVRFRELVETIPAVPYVRRLDGAFVFVGPQAWTLLGHEPPALLADRGRWVGRLHPDDRERVLAELVRAAAAGRPFRADYRFRAGGGREVWLRDAAALVRDARGEPRAWHGVLVDVSDEKARAAEFAHRALHDPLTGLANRALFFDRLDHALARARRAGGAVAVLALDLDGFKAVNDRFGHAAGDRVLVEVGHRVLAVLRPGDTAARLGGDEFGVVLEGARGVAEAERLAERIAERIVASLWAPVPVAGGEALVGASVGAAAGRPDEADAPALFERADAAMYRAKRLAAARFGWIDRADPAGAGPAEG